MTKARDLVFRIRKAAKTRGLTFKLDHEGANHTVYKLDGLVIPVPRHREIGEGLTKTIYKQCEPKLGEDWWR